MTDVEPNEPQPSRPPRAVRRAETKRLRSVYGKLKARGTRYDQQLMKKKRLALKRRNGDPQNADKKLKVWVYSVNSKRAAERGVVPV